MVLRALVLGFCLISRWAYCAADDFDKTFAQGAAYLRQGQYHLAVETLEKAQRLAQNPAQQAKATGWLGLTLYRMHDLEGVSTRPKAPPESGAGDGRERRTVETLLGNAVASGAMTADTGGQRTAEALLQEAIASGAGEAHDRARWKAALADIQYSQGQKEKALVLYSEALDLAAGDPALSAGIRLGQAKLVPPDERLLVLQDLLGSVRAIDPPEARARYLVNLGTQAGSLGGKGEKLAYESFEEASRIGGIQARVRAETLGGLAQFHETRKPDEALRLDREAIRSAEAAAARDLLVDLEWRAGRLHEKLGDQAGALAAYQRAIDHVEAIRQDIPIEYHDGRSSFVTTLGPLYKDFARLLLEQADRATADEANRLLGRARKAVELIKQSELEDFLGDRCAVRAPKRTPLETVDPRTAILYPILFPDRLVLLVDSGSELQQYRQFVDEKVVLDTGQKLAKALRENDPAARTLSQKMYRWLIEPAEPWLRQHQIETLVIVPEGVLRLIPLAALHDGTRYLIERYAIATSPGLSLLQPTPWQSQGSTALLAGMSEPGPVIDNLPPVFFQAMAGETSKYAERAEFERLRHDPDFRRSLSERLVLPGVDREIASLKRQVANKVIMNQGFTADAFKQEVVGNSYSIVHIASHGVFGHSPETSFVMAYDGVINIDELERLFSAERFKTNPVDLLILSACQTAEGDDRSPLGISGVALKANVSSALGSLWPVSDEAAARLMTEFYKVLAQPKTSKAQALRRAQESLLKDPRFAHPFYWSPFILVGNWL